MGMDVSEEPAVHMVVVRFLETLEHTSNTTAHNPEDHNVSLTVFVNNIGVRIRIKKAADTSTFK
jgi:hypothetical protein